MPLRPDEARRLTSEDEKKIQDIEHQIDAYLKDNYDNGKIIVPIKNAGDLKSRQKSVIVRDYENAGWSNVHFKEDQSIETVYIVLYGSSSNGVYIIPNINNF